MKIVGVNIDFLVWILDKLEMGRKFLKMGKFFLKLGIIFLKMVDI